MAEEFEASGIQFYGGNLWNMMNTCSSSSSSSSPSLCSIAANNDYGSNFSCTWQTHNHLMGFKSPLLVSHHHDSLGFLVHEQKQNQNESSPSSASENNGNILLDSTLAFALPPSSNWNNHSLLGRPESNFQYVLEEEEGGVDSSKSLEMKSINALQNLSYGLYDDEQNNIPLHFQPQPEESLFTNPCLAYSYINSTNQVSPNWSKASDHNFLKPSSMPKNQLGAGFQFSNNNASASDDDDVPSAAHVFASSPQSQAFQHKPSFSPLLTSKHKREEAPVSAEQPAAFKRPRIETPSPLPTFKVRKEKLGDRITALQQLVSPFGKTDTASVLHEAIEYIKYLHEQVSVLSAPYLNNNGPAVQHYQGCDEKESKEAIKQDLRSQGLCLAPISSTFSLANYEIMATELWTHAYGGAHLMR